MVHVLLTVTTSKQQRIMDVKMALYAVQIIWIIIKHDAQERLEIVIILDHHFLTARM